MSDLEKRGVVRVLPWVLIIAGVVGLIASFMLTQDTVNLLRNPAYHPNCNLNPIISCGSVMKTHEAATFGFPNPFIGLAAFPGLIVTGISLLAGGRFKRWFWLMLQAGATAGLVFVHYLFVQSVYRIGALCPYCMAVWVITIATFWYVSLYNLQARMLRLPARLQGVGNFLLRHHADIYVGWLLIIAGLILQHFWYYFGSFLH